MRLEWRTYNTNASGNRHVMTLFQGGGTKALGDLYVREHGYLLRVMAWRHPLYRLGTDLEKAKAAAEMIARML